MKRFRKCEALSKASACITKQDIISWFKRTETSLAAEGFDSILNDPSRIFNADESFFILNPSNGRAVVPKGTKNVYEVKNGSEKEGITVMAGFSADGMTVTPQIIYPFERVPATIRTTFPSTMHLSNRKSGWNNGIVFLEYISDVFHPYITKNQIQLPVILFIDGHSSHLTLDVYKTCEDMNIILIKLFPNATFLMQPADVSCFKSLKVIWKKIISEFKKNDISRRIQKTDFGCLMEAAFAQIKSETIRNGFRASGIYPWNHEAIDSSKCLGTEPPCSLSPTNGSNAALTLNK